MKGVRQSGMQQSNRFILALVTSLSVLLCGQGCVVFRYTITPPVSGTVIDSGTKQPIAGATVGFRKHEKQLAVSGDDGVFTSRPDHIWRPCFILPGELWPSGGQFFIEANGYKPFEKEIITTMGRPYRIDQPVELEKSK